MWSSRRKYNRVGATVVTSVQLAVRQDFGCTNKNVILGTDFCALVVISHGTTVGTSVSNGVELVRPK